MVSKLAIATGLMLLSTTALAQRRYGMAGCGLGSAIFGTGGMQTSAATTNQSFGTQPFGITTGTSNCLPAGQAAAMMRQDRYMIANYATLAKEMARGEGDSLQGLAMVLGCETSAFDAFAKHGQVNHADVFAAPGALAALDALKESMQSDSALLSRCSKVVL